MRITLICGSIAQKSHTNALLKHIEKLLNKKGMETVFWDLKNKPLPIAIPEYHKRSLQNTQRFSKRICKFN